MLLLLLLLLITVVFRFIINYHYCKIYFNRCHRNTTCLVVYVVRIAIFFFHYFSFCQFMIVRVMFSSCSFTQSDCYKLTSWVDEEMVSAKVAFMDKTKCNECSFAYLNNRKSHQQKM